MDYVFINFGENKLTNFAIIFGKHNLIKKESNNLFTIYTFEGKGYTIYIPILNTIHKSSFDVNDCKVIIDKFRECKKIAFLPEKIDLGEKIIKEFPELSFVHLAFSGDPYKSGYNDIVKVILNVTSKENMPKNFYFDFKLAIPFFFFKHQMSLVDFDILNNIEYKNLNDKIFVYGRRSNEIKNGMRDRGYFINKLYENVNLSKIDFKNQMHEHIELERISVGLYHLGNYFDFNKSIFNLIFESHHVDYPNEYSNWISEKTTFALLFSNPFFLMANPFLLKTLKDFGIELLNDYFEGEDIEIKFLNFCKFINESTKEQRLELHKKYVHLNKENRKKILDYIHNPKYEIIDFIIN